MSGPLLYDFGGLVTAAGLMSRNPASCVDVQNFRFPQPGVMRKRPGFALNANVAGVNEVFQGLLSSADLGDNLIGVGASVAGGPTLYGNGISSPWVAMADPDTSISANASRGPYLAVMNGNHYVVCGFSIRRLTGSAGPHRAAGMVRGLEPITYSMNPAVYSVLTGAGGFIPDGGSAAYRVTWHVLSNGVELAGPPTGRLTVRNIAGTSGYAAATSRNVNLRIPVPFALDSTTVRLTTSYFWRLWRSRTAPAGATSPDDDMYQVAEAFLSAADITNGYASVTDITPDVFMLAQPTLNTNSLNYIEAGLDNGTTFADDPPPTAVEDIAAWADCMWYAAPFTRPYLLLNLISASFVAGNTIVINGTILTAVVGVPVNPGDFTIVTTLASISLNVEATARNIVDAFNRTTGVASVRLYHTSVGTNSPGYIAIEGNSASGAPSVQSFAAGALFRPDITTARFAQSTTNRNTVYFSKPGRPDAVPVVNALTIGPSDARIFRLMPFRERLLVFTSRGLYQIDGTSFANFTVSLVDASLRILAPKTVVVLEDRCYAWCYEGIAEITDGGTRIVSQTIEPTERRIFALSHAPSSTIDSGFAVADPTNHLVYFFYDEAIAGVSSNRSKWLEYDAREEKWSAGAFTNGIGVASGVASVVSGVVSLASGSTNLLAPTGVAKTYQARSQYLAATNYQDSDYSGANTPVVSFASFQLQSPDPDARWHWQQLLVHFEDAEFSFYPRPTAFKLRWRSDIASLADVAYVPTAAIFRCETPTAARRATRQQVTLTHDTNEPCGVIAVNQTYSGAPARFPK